MTEVLLHPDVDSYLSGHQHEDRIKEKLREAAGNPEHYLKGLSNREEYSLRIGDYRAIIEWDKQQDELRVKEVGKRDGIYDT